MTPLMQQYWDVKSSHKDKIILFRMGDFFEMFHQDAETAAPILGIALTQRNKKSGDETKMCGVPHHSIAGPIAKLLSAGFKIAICDQIEDPAHAKGLVKRAVTRVLSPGMVYDPTTLDQRQGHFISAFDQETLSFLEPTTGEAFFYRTGSESDRLRIWQMLLPKELLLTAAQRKAFDTAKLTWDVHLTVQDESGGALEISGPASASRLLSYACAMQGQDLQHTAKNWEERPFQTTLAYSASVARQLELFQTYKGDRKGSLIFAIDRTVTSGGARLLRQWMQFPLLEIADIQKRQEQIGFWIQKPEGLKAVRSVLATMGDIERRLGKIASPSCNGRDLVALAQSLRAGLTVAPLCPRHEEDGALLELARLFATQIENEMEENPPLAIRQGGLFRHGANPALDELIRLTQDSQSLVNELEAREKTQTGIGSLKVRFNSVFGYYFEVTKTHSAKVPSHFQRKQTLVNAERYTTEELSKLEEKLLSAHSRRSEMEWEMFSSLRSRILAASADLLSLARRWSELDVFTGLAWLAMEQQYCQPRFTNDRLSLEAARHPVVEQEVKHSFVPNSLTLSRGHCLLLTGPNMAGKSTLMRQVAVIALLAQMGSYVPAKSAELPLFQALFTRIGASDSLSEGLSTFMVEMQEAAEILRGSNAFSLVILDEIGRGTSTYDGLSLAQAILENLMQVKKPMTMFATHYHELSQLAAKMPEIRNAHMSIHESKGQIQFLHTLVEGPANKSYGVHVGRLAGLPASVTERAKSLLNRLEQGFPADQAQMSLSADWSKPQVPQPSTPELEALANEIRTSSLTEMTPLEALNRIAQWQQSLS